MSLAEREPLLTSSMFLAEPIFRLLGHMQRAVRRPEPPHISMDETITRTARSVQLRASLIGRLPETAQAAGSLPIR